MEAVSAAAKELEWSNAEDWRGVVKARGPEGGHWCPIATAAPSTGKPRPSWRSDHVGESGDERAWLVKEGGRQVGTPGHSAEPGNGGCVLEAIAAAEGNQDPGQDSWSERLAMTDETRDLSPEPWMCELAEREDR